MHRQYTAVIRSYGAMVVAPLGGIMADKVFKSTSTWYIVAFAIAAYNVGYSIHIRT